MTLGHRFEGNLFAITREDAANLGYGVLHLIWRHPHPMKKQIAKVFKKFKILNDFRRTVSEAQARNLRDRDWVTRFINNQQKWKVLGLIENLCWFVKRF